MHVGHRFMPTKHAQRMMVACRPHYNCLGDRQSPDISAPSPQHAHARLRPRRV